MQSVDLAMVDRVLARIDDLDRVADAIAELTGRPVRVRGWESPTSDFFVEIKASRESGGCSRPRP